MFKRNSSFFKRSKKVAEEFLKTVILVDDLASFEDTPSIEPIDQLAPPPTRRRGGSRRQTNSADEPSSSSIVKTGESEFDPHQLNAKRVIDSFAQKGIVCSVLRPHENDTTFIHTLRTLAVCADVVIIDWNLHGDDGQKAQDMIVQVISSPDTPPSQLRLIVIYTGESDIAGIAQKIKLNLQQKFKNETIREEERHLTLILGANRIVVLAKEGSQVLRAYQAQVVAFQKLPDRVTDEFTVMTHGLVSNVVLRSLAQIRQKTHKILSQFSSGLDAPYLTHRALLPQPDDAQELLVSLLTEELHGILEESEVGDEANLEAIRAWLESQAEVEDNWWLNLEKNDLRISTDRLDALMKDGIQKWKIEGLSKNKTKKMKNKPHLLPLTAMFNMNRAEEEALDERFAYLTTMRSYYSHSSPILTLGTILKDKQDSSYWVCIQPRCDCVRLKEARSFPFLPLLTPDKEGRFDVIIKEDNSYRRLLCGKKAYQLKLMVFTPGSDQVVKSLEEQDAFCFKEDGKSYQWLGELRTEHSLRLSNHFAAMLSRVGLDESEWLRLWAPK
ncbi:MAG: response regulator receiver domain [Ardenticatenaceae bacterium]